MDLLRAAEVVEAGQGGRDRAPLAGRADGRPRPAVVSARHSALRVRRAGGRRGRSRRGRSCGTARVPAVLAVLVGVLVGDRCGAVARPRGTARAAGAAPQPHADRPGGGEHRQRQQHDRRARGHRRPEGQRGAEQQPAEGRHDPTTIAPASVVRNERASCCEVATGTTISAETSRRPTVRIATVTRDGGEHRDEQVVGAHPQPGDAGEVGVARHREELGRAGRASSPAAPR